MSHKKNRRRQLHLPPPPKALPMHWPGNQLPAPLPQSQPFIGPPPPKNYKEQNCLPENWNAQHEKIHKLLIKAAVDKLIELLKKFLRIKANGYKDAPQDITDAHIEVAEYILKNNFGKKI